MASSLEIQFKYKIAINVYIICISMGIISSICCGCSGKHTLLVCLIFFCFGSFFGIHGFTEPKILCMKAFPAELILSAKRKYALLKLSACSTLPASQMVRTVTNRLPH